MIWSNKNNNTLNNTKTKKVFHRFFWGFGALASGVVPIALSTSCAYEFNHQNFYVEAPDQITQDLGITSDDQIANEITTFNQKNMDEKIDHLFGSDSKLVKTYIDTFVATANGKHAINFVLTLQNGFVFKGTQQHVHIFQWALKTLSRNMPVLVQNIPTQRSGEASGDYCNRLERDFCTPFNNIDSLAQKILIAFGDRSELNVHNTKTLEATVNRDKNEIDFNTILNSGFVFNDNEKVNGINNPNTNVFAFKLDAPFVEPTDYNHILVVKNLDPANFVKSFNESSHETKEKDLLGGASSSFSVKSAGANVDGTRCRISFTLTKKAANSDIVSDQLTTFVVSETEFLQLTNLIDSYDHKSFDVAQNAFLKNITLQTMTFADLNRELNLGFPGDLVSGLYIRKSSFDHGIKNTIQQVNLTCEIALYPHKYVSTKLARANTKESFIITLENFSSPDIQTAVKVLGQYANTLTDTAQLTDLLSEVIVPPKPAANFDYKTINLKAMLNKVHEPLSNILCRDSQLLSLINDVLKKSKSISGFNLIELEPFVQSILMGIFQNLSVNQIIYQIIGPAPTVNVSLSSAVTAAEELLTNPMFVGKTLSTLLKSEPILSLMSKPINGFFSGPWWEYAIDGNKDLLTYLVPKMLDVPTFDLIDGIASIYITEELSYLKRMQSANGDDLKKIENSLETINTTLFGVEKEFKDTVYITNKESKEFKSSLKSSANDIKERVGFNLPDCAYRNLLDINKFLSLVPSLCEKRFKGASGDGNQVTIPINGETRPELETFGFIVSKVQANEDKEKLVVTFHDDHSNPWLSMQINDGPQTVLSANNLSKTHQYWVGDHDYAKGLFNVSFFDSLVGNKSFIKAVLGLIPITGGIFSDLPGYIDELGISGQNIYNIFQSILSQLEEKFDYRFAQKLLFNTPTYNLAYDDASHNYIFGQEYHSPDLENFTLDVGLLHTLLGNLQIYVSQIRTKVQVAQFISNEKISFPINFSLRNSLYVSRFDLLNTTTRLIKVPQEFDFAGMNDIFDHIFGLNIGQHNPDRISIFAHGFMAMIVEGVIQAKVTVSGEKAYKHLNDDATIDFFS